MHRHFEVIEWYKKKKKEIFLSLDGRQFILISFSLFPDNPCRRMYRSRGTCLAYETFCMFRMRQTTGWAKVNTITELNYKLASNGKKCWKKNTFRSCMNPNDGYSTWSGSHRVCPVNFQIHYARWKTVLLMLLRCNVCWILRLLRRTNRSGSGTNESRRSALACDRSLFFV